MPRDAGPRGAAPKAASVDEALDLVRQHGGRVTSSRRLLLDVLFTDSEHLSAEELAARVQAQAPDIHLSTVYRNLEELERLGVVVHTHVGHGPATYHLASSIHGHFVCERCGSMTEVPENLFAELVSAADASYDFEIDPHHFAVLGLCRDCR